jgi:ATP-binding cassette subfamily C (CFTR/MRP) protein 4
MRYRVGAIAAIHNKILHLPSASVDCATSSGRAINLATNDVERLMTACMCGSYIIWTPLLSIGIFGIGWYIIGWPFACGFVLLVFAIVPFQLSLSKKFASMRSEIASITDEVSTVLAHAFCSPLLFKHQQKSRWYSSASLWCLRLLLEQEL